MHWALVALAVALAVAFYQFGAVTVWITVLSVALKSVLLAAGIVALGVLVSFLWRRYR